METQGDDKIKYCKTCTNRTLHKRRGFGSPGGLVGNARWSCKECENNGKD